MKKKFISVLLCVSMITSLVVGCAGNGGSSEGSKEEEKKESTEGSVELKEDEGAELTLGDYEPEKKEYNFYFTYKLVHAWWDAVGLGLKEAQEQYADKGITINYEYVAPPAPDAIDQVNRLEEAAGRNFDVIGVDVNDIEIVTPTINNLIDQGNKIMTFSSSDATKEDGCKRIAYVGNTHNYEDGADLAEILAEIGRAHV